MDHITKTPLRVNDEVAQVSKSSPTIFLANELFPCCTWSGNDCQKKKGFRHLTKKNRFFQPRLKIPALVTFT